MDKGIANILTAALIPLVIVGCFCYFISNKAYKYYQINEMRFARMRQVIIFLVCFFLLALLVLVVTINIVGYAPHMSGD